MSDDIRQAIAAELAVLYDGQASPLPMRFTELIAHLAVREAMREFDRARSRP
jgi:hypothetical protein